MKFSDAIVKFTHLVPGCPEFEAEEALRFAVIEFCKGTQIMTQWVSTTSDLLSFPTTGGTAPVQMVGLFDAYVDGAQVPVVHMNSADIGDATDQNRVITHGADLNTTINVVPVPASELPVVLLAAFAPTPDAQEFADFIWMAHREALKHGALARLMSDPGTAYVNENRAMDYRVRFDQAITDAGAAISVNRTTRSQRLRVRPAGSAQSYAQSISAITPSNTHTTYWDAGAAWTATNYWM